MKKPVIKLPDSKGGWASLLLGFGLMVVGVAHFLQGDYEQSTLDFGGAFGTLGLPAIFGKGYHIEVRKDVTDDTSRPQPMPPARRPANMAEVRRADEHE